MRPGRHEFRYDRWCGWLLGLFGTGRRVSHVTVRGTEVQVVMGWAFRSTIPIASIRAIRPIEARVWGWGVHGWRGRWLVNGSSRGLVRIDLDPPVPSRVCGIRVQLRELIVSLDEPRALLG